MFTILIDIYVDMVYVGDLEDVGGSYGPRKSKMVFTLINLE